MESQLPGTPSEERKVVTALFVDLVGFTARSDLADPEDVRALLRPYHACAKEEIERLGGTVEKFVGDAVMGVFGVPIAHEDDAERAVRAGLAVVERVARLNEASGAGDLTVRAALETGEALVDLAARAEEGESVVAGDVVNTASRLQQVAPENAVIAGERAYAATNSVVDYEELPPVAVKGKRSPLRAWRVRAVRARPEAEATQAPFVGRDEDLALLERTFARTLRESSVQLVTIAGEPGVGKTRLVEQLRRTVQETPDRVLWRRGRCLPYGEGITFWALGEIVKSHTGILESDTPELAAEKLGAAVGAVVDEPAERDWLAASLAPLVGARLGAELGADERAETSFTNWRRFLELVARRAPLVLVVEDLHWADSALLDFLEHLIDRSAPVPLLLVCTARPEFYERRLGWGGGKRNSTTISLAPLTDEETVRLIAALLSQAVLPAETQAALLERSGGNPLYAQEFVRMLTDRGILKRRDGTAVIDAGAEIPVPESIHAVIAARLDTLAPERKSLLQDAAVVGKVFWSGALAAMGEVGEEAVEAGLPELARMELIRRATASSVRDESEYFFSHVLVRDVAYGQIPRAARAAKHEAAARWIEQLAGERVTDHAEVLAHHYVQALELRRAAGSADDARALEEHACRLLVLAGDRAIQLDVDKAEAYYRRALELLPSDDSARPRVLGKVGESAWLAGRIPEAEQALAEVIALLRAQGDLRAAGEAIVWLVQALRDRGETDRARGLLDEAIELLEREPPGQELALAYLHDARDGFLGGRSHECIESSEKAIQLFRQLDLEHHVVRALQFRGAARVELGDLSGLDDLRESLRMSLELGLGYYTVNAYSNLGSEVLWFDAAEALELLQAGVAFGDARGIAFKARWVEAETLWALFDLGRWDELLATAGHLVAWDQEYGGSQVGVIAHIFEANVLVRRGRAAVDAPFLERARSIGDPQVLSPALITAGLIREQTGDRAAVVPLLDEFHDATRRAPLYRAWMLPDAVRLAVAAEATPVAEMLLPGCEAAPGARPRCALLTARAVLAENSGHPDEAVALYQEAVVGWARYGNVLERGLALLGAGRCRLALGPAGEASTSLNEAQEVFRQLGATPLVARTDAAVAARS
jgi:class 3 adenylate cyclase/tetratricopeptide (TPR) repeat protein